MQRYFLSSNDREITGSDAHHIMHVMRMSSGDNVIVCFDKRCFLSALTIENQRVFYDVVEELHDDKGAHITLIQGLPKHPKGETVSKYATMFGASEIIFVPMQRSIAKLDNEANKLKRMHAIAKEAAELAHRFDVPQISFAASLKQMHWDYDILLVADENEKTKTLYDALPKISEHLKIALVIGPEGGLSDAERTFFDQQGAHMVSLGKLILPTELASLYALTYLSLKNF